MERGALGQDQEDVRPGREKSEATLSRNHPSAGLPSPEPEGSSSSLTLPTTALSSPWTHLCVLWHTDGQDCPDKHSRVIAGKESQHIHQIHSLLNAPPAGPPTVLSTIFSSICQGQVPTPNGQSEGWRTVCTKGGDLRQPLIYSLIGNSP